MRASLAFPPTRPGSAPVATFRRVGVIAAVVAVSLCGCTLAAAERCRDKVPTGAAIRLAPANEPGEPLVIEGRVTGRDGRPLAGAVIHAYQADAAGEYGDLVNDNPRLCGVLRTDARGLYRIATVRPSSRRNLEGGPPHVHFELRVRGRPGVQALLQFDELRGVAPAAVRAKTLEGVRTGTTRPIARDAGGVWRCVRDFRLD
jgi:protocatechuate 3,4-dioxygenase beta subunit